MTTRPESSAVARRPWLARRRLAALTLGVALLALAGCASLGYYGQAVWGQTRILVERESIARLVESARTPEELRHKLRVAEQIRTFAVAELGLPDNGSYRSYVELAPAADGGRRTYVVWNVVAAPELAVEPITWCFPIAGCVAYRGYFAERRARRFAERLRQRGFDVTVGGVAAYSTLGWLKDPILSTVIDYPEVELAGLLFHELAHQVVYVRDDTRFNESFATAVELEGVRRWLAADDRPPAALERYREQLRREDRLVELLLDYRERLRAVYSATRPDDWKRREKRRLFAELDVAYAELVRGWSAGGEPAPLRPLNNADLAAVASYRDLVPAFQRLLAAGDGDLELFYAEVRRLAELDAEEREKALLEHEAERGARPTSP